MLLLTALSSISNAQTNSFGLSIGVGGGTIMQKGLDGGGSTELQMSITAGFLYQRKLKEKLHLQTGLNWYNGSFSVTPSFQPGLNMTPSEYDISLIYIPMFLKVDVAKYFFINGGLLADIDITKDNYLTNQSGVGAGLGIGTEFSITDKLAIQVNPLANFHGLLVTKNEDYPQSVFDATIKVALIFK